MALWVCKACGCKFAVGLSMCPQCTGTDVEEDSELPKITLSGPSNAALDAELAASGELETKVIRAKDKEAETSAGTSSSKRTSSQKTEASEETKSKPKSAPTTASRTKKE